MRVLGIIPARYASSRLPGKPLVDIGGKSMIQRVVEQAQKAGALDRVVVATDDQRIMDHVLSFGGEALLTSPDHTSGTDRCNEALRSIGESGYDAVVNIQGDEPFIEAGQIDELCKALSEASGGIATLAQVVTDERDLTDPGEVLLVTTVDMDALCFSRTPIPFIQGTAHGPRHKRFRFLKHVGLYAYRTAVLQQLVALAPSALEKAESLEQLRWLENGFRIRVGLTEHPSFCVDTPADLEEARQRVLKARF